MTENPIVGKLRERNFRDEFRFQPVGALTVGARHLDGRFVHFQRLHSFH
jgi:hypothetical protein